MDDSTTYPVPRNPEMVRALAGDSTMTSFIDLVGVGDQPEPRRLQLGVRLTSDNCQECSPPGSSAVMDSKPTTMRSAVAFHEYCPCTHSRPAAPIARARS